MAGTSTEFNPSTDDFDPDATVKTVLNAAEGMAAGALQVTELADTQETAPQLDPAKRVLQEPVKPKSGVPARVRLVLPEAGMFLRIELPPEERAKKAEFPEKALVRVILLRSVTATLQTFCSSDLLGFACKDESDRQTEDWVAVRVAATLTDEANCRNPLPVIDMDEEP